MPYTILVRCDQKVNVSWVKSCDSKYLQIVLFDEYLKFKVSVRRFWARAIQTASQSSQHHFLDSMTAYLHAIVPEAEDRDHSHCRSIDDYLKLRRDTCGARPSFAIYEMGMEFPDEVFYHPMIVELRQCIVELILIDNVKSSPRGG